MADQAVTVSKQEMRRRATLFSSNFKDSTSEQADRQTFWNEFFEIFGISRRQVAAFELLAHRASTGRLGWIDLLYPGSMGVEHKSAGEDLGAAMGQLLDYLPSLAQAEHPWLLVACDFRQFMWRNLDNGTHGEFPLEDLESHLDLFWWIAGYGSKTEFENIEDANLKATKLMADIHDDLIANGYAPHALREWLTRILFCLFADDAGVWDRAAFHAYIAVQTKVDGSDLGPAIAYLFQIMDTPDGERPRHLDEDVAQFTYINGDLFAETLPIPTCGPGTRSALLKACLFDWSAISPAIFGSMFQEVMSKTERRQLGAHYTTEENILRTIGPLFLDALRNELEAATSKPKLDAFLGKLASLTFFDPACGCGNFLVITYREIRELETEALRRLRPKNRRGRLGQLSIDISIQFQVKVDQFYGIEVEEFPAKIARTALYLMDHLSNTKVSQEFGEHYARFPIPASPHIHIGNACRLDWNTVLPANRANYVFGNPPFIGMSLMDKVQDEDNKQVFAKVDAADLRTGRLDYVACWYALCYLYGAGTAIRFALVSTNSITQGEQARSLGPLMARTGYHIDFAHHTFRWFSEAKGKAAVHVVIIGFSQTGTGKKRLFSYDDIAGEPAEAPATQINWYLTDAPEVIVGKHTRPFVASLPKLTEGNRPEDGGGLLLSPAEAAEIRRTDPVAAKYVRELVGAHELLQGDRRYCLWLVDATPQELRSSAVLKERLARTRKARLDAIANTRSDARKDTLRRLADRPALFTAIRQPTGSWLCAPAHSSENRAIVPMAMLPAKSISHNSTQTADGLPKWAFAVMQSAMYTTWLRSICGRIKSDIRIAPDLAYNAFPFIDPPTAVRAKLETAITTVVAARENHPGASLADLYDPLAMPADLRAAHASLDKVVDRLFAGQRKVRTEADRLAILLERYAKLVETESLFPAPKTERRR